MALIGIDVGFGDTKVVMSKAEYFKFPTAIAYILTR
jgi:hypothetical protein